LNARDAMPRGGRLVIETANADYLDVSRELARALAPGRYATLSVRDTGIGMDEETRVQIFEPFFTTKEDDHGTGLGLSSAYAIITGAGGRIFVESAPDEGTVFTIYLPVTDARI